jgi:hypothetical protein
MVSLARLLAAGAIAATAAGCSVGYVLENYSAVGPANVDLSCHQTFQLFEHQGLRRILVKPYPASEAAYLACAAISKEESARALRDRAAEAVERHFETTKRPACHVTGVEPIGIGNYEASYDCTPPKPIVSPPAKASTRPG